MKDVVFKQAAEIAELEQIHRLNHRTFAEELGQYDLRASSELVDRFHHSNHYFVAKRGETVVGMISVNWTPPFSVEKRLQDAATILRQFRAPCEIRMLAIAESARDGIVLAGLFWQAYEEAREQGCSHMLISGIEDRAQMYRSLGFHDLGVAVPSGAVSFIPMALALDDPALVAKAQRFEDWWQRRDGGPVSLLPGPVQISRGVRRAFEQAPVSHRSNSMVKVFGEVRRMLSELAGGMAVALMTGSGTLSNDAVAACLRARFGDAPGLLLANGEFGERLLRQARAAGLRFSSLQWEWGHPWDFERIAAEFRQGVRWVWCVHLETSTGQLNDLRRLSWLCELHEIALAADCVSSLGAVSLEECRLVLASGVSGKALGAYAGLAVVFADESMLRETAFDGVPATFHIAQNIASEEPMFTVASPQLRALYQALDENYRDARSRTRRYAHYCSLSRWVRDSLRQRGVMPLVDDETAAPVICTFALTDDEIARRCSEAGFQIAHESSYLVERGWGQISVMGDLTQRCIEPVFGLF